MKITSRTMIITPEIAKALLEMNMEVSMDDNTFTMRYINISSKDRDTIEAALGSDHELVKRLKEQFIDSPEEARYRAAAQADATDELEVDDNAVVSIGDDGAFVMSWMWIEADEEDGDDEEDEVAH